MRSPGLLSLLVAVSFLASCASQPRQPQAQRKTASHPASPVEVAPPFGKNECATPGDVKHWEVAYCLWKTGTDDEFSGAVQECLNGEIKSDPSIPKSECDRKLVLKTSMVRNLCAMTAIAEAGARKPDSQTECFRKRFDKFIPTTVKTAH